MTIKELLLAIKGLPEDMQIILAKDAEGNDYTPLADIAIGVYETTTTWNGEFLYSDEDQEIPEDECNALCLEPTN